MSCCVAALTFLTECKFSRISFPAAWAAFTAQANADEAGAIFIVIDMGRDVTKAGRQSKLPRQTAERIFMAFNRAGFPTRNHRGTKGHREVETLCSFVPRWFMLCRARGDSFLAVDETHRIRCSCSQKQLS